MTWSWWSGGKSTSEDAEKTRNNRTGFGGWRDGSGESVCVVWSRVVKQVCRKHHEVDDVGFGLYEVEGLTRICGMVASGWRICAVPSCRLLKVARSCGVSGGIHPITNQDDNTTQIRSFGVAIRLDRD